MIQTKIWQITLFQNLILFTSHYGNLQEMLEMASFLRYADLYLTSEWGRFYVGHPVHLNNLPSNDIDNSEKLLRINTSLCKGESWSCRVDINLRKTCSIF
jgi:hypothetical protein